LLILHPIVKDRETMGDSDGISRTWLAESPEDNRGINDRQNTIRGMLLFPFGNLSHTSILYYMLLYPELEYNFFNDFMMGSRQHHG
jgi:hypothetical protein